MTAENLYFNTKLTTLIPERINGLILSGRTISVDDSVFAATRVMGPCIAIGEAAGTAAAMCIQENKQARELSVAQLRATLKNNGVVL